MDDEICSECLRECREVAVDNGIGPYEFWGQRGVHTDIHPGSDCCEAEVWHGVCVRVRDTVHTARKDHLNHAGRPYIFAGQRYRLEVYRGYAVSPDTGERRGIKHIDKTLIRRGV